MPARKRKTKLSENWKYYVYQFFNGDICVYVGKGCGNRFNLQEKRFFEFKGHIVAYFENEAFALNYEKLLINDLAPSHNIAMNPVTPEPWKYSLLPYRDNDFGMWCEKLGTRNMAARVLLSKPWSIMKSYDTDIERLLSVVDKTFCGVYHGARC